MFKDEKDILSLVRRHLTGSLEYPLLQIDWLLAELIYLITRSDHFEVAVICQGIKCFGEINPIRTDRGDTFVL